MKRCCQETLREFGGWAGAGERTATIILENPKTENREYARGVGFAYGSIVDAIDRRLQEDPPPEEPEAKKIARAILARPLSAPPEKDETKRLATLAAKKTISEACGSGLHRSCMMSFCPCRCHA